jgi:hypothetical protein
MGTAVRSAGALSQLHTPGTRYLSISHTILRFPTRCKISALALMPLRKYELLLESFIAWNFHHPTKYRAVKSSLILQVENRM